MRVALQKKWFVPAVCNTRGGIVTAEGKMHAMGITDESPTSLAPLLMLCMVSRA